MSISAPLDTNSALAREVLRSRYLPQTVRMLFVGEAPPASGRFFYQGDSGLYRAVRDTFLNALPFVWEENFLQTFAGMGCYLVDLCERPVDRLPSSDRKHACREGEVNLSRMIEELRPQTIITVVRSIAANVRRAARAANWQGAQVELPYPGRWRHLRICFEEGLKPVLREELALSRLGEFRGVHHLQRTINHRL